MPLTTSPWTIIKPSDLKCNPQAIFIFGDNFTRRGKGGFARVTRGKPNTIGLITKRYPGMAEEDFLNSGDLAQVITENESSMERIYSHLKHGKHVIWPQAGIGTGLAQLDIRAPSILSYYTSLKRELEEYGKQFPTTQELH